jgi:hypothetical protein
MRDITHEAERMIDEELRVVAITGAGRAWADDMESRFPNLTALFMGFMENESRVVPALSDTERDRLKTTIHQPTICVILRLLELANTEVE